MAAFSRGAGRLRYETSETAIRLIARRIVLRRRAHARCAEAISELRKNQQGLRLGMVLDAADFLAITDSALKRFDEGVAASDPEIGGKCDLEVARLESQMIQLYGIAALLARREMDLGEIAEVWGSMISVCDTVAQKIQRLCGEHTFCVASHDRILDIRNKSARLRELHL